jgi:hypothetical protein
MLAKKVLAFIEVRENVSFIEQMHSKTVKTPQSALDRSERAKGEGGGQHQQANKCSPCSFESIYEMKIALIMSQPNQLVIIYRL